MQPRGQREDSFTILIAVSLLSVPLSCKAAPTASGPSQFLRALKARDYNTIIDLTDRYQAEMEALKSQNPKTLWPRVLDEYRTSKRAALSTVPSYWQSYAEGVGGLVGDPAHSIRQAQFLVTPACNWRITETRTEDVRDSFGQGPYRRLVAFVQIDYPSNHNAPLLDGKALKQTLLAFEFRAPSERFLGVTRVPRGDIFWTISGLTAKEALDALRNDVEGPASPELLWSMNAYIKPGSKEKVPAGETPWLGVRLPENPGPQAVELESLFRRHGFTIDKWVIRPGWGANSGWVKPPAAWQTFASVDAEKYLLTTTSLESPNIDIRSVNTDGPTATAELHFVLTGCTEACRLVREYWASPISKTLGYNRFFAVFWEGLSDVNGLLGTNWPTQGTRTVYFQYSPTSQGQGQWLYSGVRAP